MLLPLRVCCLLAVVVVAFHQSDYEMIHHRLELISYNRKFLRNLKADLIPFNRTTRALNVSFDLVVDFSLRSIQMVIQAFKLSMNDYRPFPLHLDLNYCKMRIENSFGVNDMASYSNIPPCPVKKGHYYINKYRPDEAKFPPHVFPGEYKLEINFVYESENTAEVHWYGVIKPIETLRFEG